MTSTATVFNFAFKNDCTPVSSKHFRLAALRLGKGIFFTLNYTGSYGENAMWLPFCPPSNNTIKVRILIFFTYKLQSFPEILV